MRHALYGLASGTVLAAAAAWLLSAARTPEQPLAQPSIAVPATVMQQQLPHPAAQLQPPVPQAELRTSAAFFEGRFEAGREMPRPAPDPAILQARSFPEAIQAMKRAEVRLPANGAGENPFASAR